VKQANTYIQIRQAGTYYLDNIKMYRTYQDTVFVGGFDVDMVYRYGFNGMLKDNEIKGKGNSYDFGARLYDSRLGRWLSLDDLAQKKPYLSPYQAMRNNPLIYNDPDGNDEYLTIVINDKRTGRKTTLEIPTAVSTRVRTDYVRKNQYTSINYYDFKTTITLTIEESGERSVNTQYSILYSNGVKDNDFIGNNPYIKPKPDFLYTLFHSEGEGGTQPDGYKLTTEEGGVSSTKYIAEHKVKSIDITALLAAFGGKGKSLAKPTNIEEGMEIITELYKEISEMAEDNIKGTGEGTKGTGHGGTPGSGLNVYQDSVIHRTPDGTYRIQVDSSDAGGYPNENNSRKISNDN